MDKYERTVLNRKIWVKKEVKDTAPVRRYIKRTIPRKKYKNELLHDYIKNTDTVYRKDLDKMGYHHIDSSLNRYSKFYKTKIVPIDYNTWAIER